MLFVLKFKRTLLSEQIIHFFFFDKFRRRTFYKYVFPFKILNLIFSKKK